MPDIEFDPQRLLALARKARDAKAVARAATDRAHDLREQRADIQRRAQLAKENAAHNGPRASASYVEQAHSLAKQAEGLAIQLRDAGADAADLASVAGAHGRAFAAAIQFAVERNLDVPAELSDQAAVLRSGSHPAMAAASNVAKFI